jgi:hypothetical protein
MYFLFDNFQIFLIVYVAVLLDTVLGVVQAKIAARFNWGFLPEFINTMIEYTIYLIFGNLVEHFAKLTGIRIEGAGLYFIAAVLIAVEGASIIGSIKQLQTKKP